MMEDEDTGMVDYPLDDPAASIGQSVKFSPNVSSSRLKLVELPRELEELLCDPENNAQTFVIKGAGKENCAVLCTSNTTYTMRKAESSNAYLLMNLMENDSLVIRGELYEYYELIKSTPRVQELRGLLLTRPCTRNNANSSNPIGFEFDALLDQVQASPAELLEELHSLGATEINDRWTLVAPDLEYELIEVLLCTMIEHSIEATHVSEDVVVCELSDLYHGSLVRSILKKYGTRCAGLIWELDSRKLSRAHAERMLLKHPNQEMVKSEFESSWRDGLPNGLQVEDRFLAGLVLEEIKAGITFIIHFPANALPRDARSCFQVLFYTRKMWRLKDLEPFIDHLIEPSISKADLLRKYTRSSRVSLTSEERVLSAR